MRHTIPKKDFFSRTRKLLSGKLDKDEFALFQSADEVYRSGDQLFPFRQDANFFYLTGIESPNCKLIIFADGTARLFMPKPNPKKEVWEGKMMTVDEAREISGIEKVQYLDDFAMHLNLLLKQKSNLAICHKEYPKSHQIGELVQFVNELVKQYPGLNVRHLNYTMTELRMIKHPEEIQQIQQAIDITKKGFDAVYQFVEPGVWEFEIEALMKKTFLDNRSHGEAFPTIAGAGKNGATLHYVANNCQVTDNDLVLIDAGADFGYYSADITRTFSANGKFTTRQHELYCGLLDIQETLIKMVGAGKLLKGITKESQNLIGSMLKSVGLIDDEKQFSKYYMHNVGHHLGIDTHDVSLFDRSLEVGNIITIEPGIYIPEENIGIRIEDNILITEDGYINLSQEIRKKY